jgi:hypothetical protein
MHDLRKFINIVEARSHPDINPKPLTSDIFQKYQSQYGSDGVYVHFNSIEKVGINIKSQNTFGPLGIYAMPIGIASTYGLDQTKMMKDVKYANVILPKNSINILNLDTVNVAEMQQLVQSALAFHKRKLKAKSDFYSSIQLPQDIRQCWRLVVKLLYEYASRRRKKLMYILNSFFRKIGYDAILDSNQIINDNPNQIVFLSSNAFTVLETIPLRFAGRS